MKFTINFIFTCIKSIDKYTVSMITDAPSGSADKLTSDSNAFLDTVAAASLVNLLINKIMSVLLYSNSCPSLEPVKPYNNLKFFSIILITNGTNFYSHSLKMCVVATSFRSSRAFGSRNCLISIKLSIIHLSYLCIKIFMQNICSFTIN